MGLLTRAEQRRAEGLAALAFSNPFLPERMELERSVLGERRAAQGAVWSHRGNSADADPNFAALSELAGELVFKLRREPRRLAASGDEPLRLYEDLASFQLYYEFRADLQQLRALQGPARQRHLRGFWGRYRQRFAESFELDGCSFSPHIQAAHLFAWGYQLWRAFEHTFYYIIGQSASAAALRGAIWQSIFTHDMRRYHRGFFQRMGDYVTLVTGPSGTGKELVARAIGLSRYVPFDGEQLEFLHDETAGFISVNLSALSPTLIESELFGHRKGAFTGAVADRVGWLESCPDYGTVFLDEIGDLDPQIQVKLLRVFQDRIFQRLGETTSRTFGGKIIAATNRDLGAEIASGRFREDFYYRICSDVISTPSLQQRVREDATELEDLVRFLVQRDGLQDGASLTREVLDWITQHLGPAYAWPGNIRELEQCVRNVLIRQHYEPLARPQERPASDDAEAALELATEGATLSADELLNRYCRLAYRKLGSYDAAAAALRLDRRTVRRRNQV